jgi:hypothetical protein
MHELLLKLSDREMSGVLSDLSLSLRLSSQALKRSLCNESRTVRIPTWAVDRFCILRDPTASVTIFKRFSWFHSSENALTLIHHFSVLPFSRTSHQVLVSLVKSGPINTERYPELFTGYTLVPTAKNVTLSCSIISSIAASSP